MNPLAPKPSNLFGRLESGAVDLGCDECFGFGTAGVYISQRPLLVLGYSGKETEAWIKNAAT